MLNNHPFLTDGLVEAFRAPDLCWVGSSQGNSYADWDEGLANCSDLLFSNFWVGPADKAKQFAETLSSTFEKVLGQRNDENSEDAPLVAVFYYDGPTPDLALVGYLSMTEDYIYELIQEDEAFEQANALTAGLFLVASDGNDNSPHTMFNYLEECPFSRDQVVELVVSTTKSEYQDEVREAAEE